MIRTWLATYQPGNRGEVTQALREIMQQIALAGLYRMGFFEKAAFYGGTALRIFYQLDRFSEDLDFSLLQPDANFTFKSYIPGILKEFESLGLKVSVREKTKVHGGSIESAFLKSETIWQELVLEDIIPQYDINLNVSIKIKLEVDKIPPLNFNTEEKLLLQPFSFYVKCFTLSDLFAGKIHALLYRKWGTNVKGRDWYDMEWHIKKGVVLNLNHFLERAIMSGDWNKETINKEEFISLIRERIAIVSMERVKDDIKRFISNPNVLNIWSSQYFNDLITHLQVATHP